MISDIFQRWIFRILGGGFAFACGVWLWEHGVRHTIGIAQSFALAIAFLAYYFWPLVFLLIVFRRRKPNYRKRPQNAHN